MPNIFVQGSGYKAPPSIQGWRWLPFTNTAMLDVLEQAIAIINSEIQHQRAFNKTFRNLPGGQSFSEIWNQAGLWISYDPDKSGTKYSITLNRQHISITGYALAMGKWTTISTLIHELAIINGAQEDDKRVEKLLLKSLLHQHYSANIMGEIRRINEQQPNAKPSTFSPPLSLSW